MQFQKLNTKTMNNLMQFGENVEGYNIPVLNEREIRAAAGILFLATFISLMLIVFKNNFLPIKYVITIFLTDFIVRVFINPKFSPSLIIGRLIVGKQVPEYVGAQQKKFAWVIGLILSATMFIFLVLVNAYSPITGITCLVCLVFLFFETAFGICLGCKFYSLFYKAKAQYCPGEVCDRKSKQAIQKTSSAQVMIVVAFIGFIFFTGFLFNNQFSKKPHDMFGMFGSKQSGQKVHQITSPVVSMTDYKALLLQLPVADSVVIVSQSFEKVNLLTDIPASEKMHKNVQYK
jgi:hypothetical protein